MQRSSAPFGRLRRPSAFWLCCLASIGSEVLAQGPVSPTLLVDIDQRPSQTPRDSAPRFETASPGVVWFSATTPEHARELWRTDGTAAGTLLIDELGSGTDQAYRHGTALPNGTLLMSSTTAATGTEPYAAAPGSTSLTLLADLAPGAASSFPSRAAVVGNLGWFSTDGRANAGLWQTDGTPAGTVLDESLAGVPFVRLAAAAGKLWMIDGRLGSGALRVKDGPGIATRALVPSGGLVAHEVVGEVNGRAVFVGETAANGIEPWVSDGTVAGTRQLADIAPGAFSSQVWSLAEEPGRLWFAGRRNTSGIELWTTDGTPAGTSMVRELRSGVGDGVDPAPRRAALLNGGLLFVGNDGSTGWELWFSDGTVTGTRLVRDLEPGVGGSMPRGLVAHGGAVWFGAETRPHGFELWRTDGTAAGTVRMTDLVAGPGGSGVEPFASTAGGVVFSADDDVTGVEPWVFDPVAGQARQLGNLAVDPTTLSEGIGALAVHDDFVLFSAAPNGGAREAFVSDGTAAGTVPLGVGLVRVREVTPVADLPRGLVFEFADQAGNDTLWITAGTPASTRQLASLRSFSPPQIFEPVGRLPVIDGRAYFQAAGTFQTELWSTDGTPGGTAPVPGLPSSLDFKPFVAFGGLLIGQGFDMTAGVELWVSDLTSAGTRPLGDLSPGTAGSFPLGMLPFDAGVFFVAMDPTHGREPWITDGTPRGTRLLADLAPGTGDSSPRQMVSLGDRVMFATETALGAPRLWVTDGTTAGTVAIATFPTSSIGPTVRQLVVSGSKVFAQVASPDGRSVDLWVTDATAAGTRRVIASNGQGPRLDRQSGVISLTAEGLVTFTAWDPRYGNELWMSDGTVAGTRPFADSFPGGASSDAYAAIRLGGQALFVADDGRTGRELHAVPLAALGIPLAEPLGRGCGGASVRATGAPRVGGPSFDALFQASAPGRQALGLVADVRAVFGVPMPGCEIHLPNPIAIGAGTTDAQGLFRLTLSVPNQPVLVGTRFYLQAAIVKANGPLFGALEATEALELQIGR